MQAQRFWRTDSDLGKSTVNIALNWDSMALFSRLHSSVEFIHVLYHSAPLEWIYKGSSLLQKKKQLTERSPFDSPFRFDSNQIELSEQMKSENKVWLARHLERMRKMMLDDLLNVKVCSFEFYISYFHYSND